ncbi:MAG: tetratricopeptide repeat protein [Planctomycetota bacterium]
MLTATVFAVFAALACLPVAGCDTVAGRMANAAEAARQGDNFLAKGNRHKAVEAYTRAIKLKPDLTSAYLSRAVALNELGQPEEALADFTKAIELDPTNSYPYEQRSHIYRTALKDSRRADADKARAEALRQGRWNNLQKLRKK